MLRLAVVSSTLFALLFPGGAQAWTWPIDGPVLRPFVFGSDPYAAGQHRGIDVGGAVGESVRAPVGGERVVRRIRSCGRSRADDPHRRRLLRDAAAARLDRRATRRRGGGGRARRRGRRELRRGNARAARAPRRAAHRRRGGLPRPARVPARAPAGRGPAPAPAPAASPPPVQPQPAPPAPRVEQPAPAPAAVRSAAAPRHPAPATPAAPTWSEEPVVASAEPVEDRAVGWKSCRERGRALPEGSIVRAGSRAGCSPALTGRIAGRLRVRSRARRSRRRPCDERERIAPEGRDRRDRRRAAPAARARRQPELAPPAGGDVARRDRAAAPVGAPARVLALIAAARARDRGVHGQRKARLSWTADEIAST